MCARHYAKCFPYITIIPTVTLKDSYYQLHSRDETLKPRDTQCFSHSLLARKWKRRNSNSMFFKSLFTTFKDIFLALPMGKILWKSHRYPFKKMECFILIFHLNGWDVVSNGSTHETGYMELRSHLKIQNCLCIWCCVRNYLALLKFLLLTVCVHQLIL